MVLRWGWELLTPASNHTDNLEDRFKLKISWNTPGLDQLQRLILINFLSFISLNQTVSTICPCFMSFKDFHLKTILTKLTSETDLVKNCVLLLHNE